MLALYEDLIPRFCPCCGIATGLDRLPSDTERRHGISVVGDYLAGAAHVCQGCGLLYAQARREHILTAADAAGTDLRRQWERERA